MRDVALEIPLGPFTVIRGWQCSHAADSRVEPLGDTLDHTALSSGVPPFQNHYQLLTGMCDPILQLYKFTL